MSAVAMEWVGHRARESSPRRGLLIAALVLVAVVDLVLLVRRALLDVVSPYDEGYHLSYVQYAHNWSLPRWGDPMSGWAEEAYACHLTFPFGQVTGVPCGIDGDSGLYPEGGTNSAAGWPPLYYIVTAQIVRVLTSFTSLDPLHSARMSSALLWTVGCVLLAWLVMKASGSLALGAVAGILGTANPAVWAIGSYVTPHSTAMLVSVGLIALLGWVAGPVTRPVLALVVVSISVAVLISMTLPHGVAAVLAVCVALVAAALHRRPMARRLVLSAGALGLFNLIGNVGWGRFAASRVVGPTPQQPATPPEGLLAASRDNWDLFLPRLLGEVAFTSPVQTQAAKALGYLLLMLLGAWVLRRGMPAQRSVALGQLVAAPLTAVAMALQFDFPVPPRYGASLLGLMLFLLALRGSARWVRIVLSLVAVALVVVSWESTDSYLVMAIS